MLLCGGLDWRFETVFGQDKTNQPDTTLAGGGVAQPGGSSDEPYYIRRCGRPIDDRHPGNDASDIGFRPAGPTH